MKEKRGQRKERGGGVGRRYRKKERGGGGTEILISTVYDTTDTYIYINLSSKAIHTASNLIYSIKQDENSI